MEEMDFIDENPMYGTYNNNDSKSTTTNKVNKVSKKPSYGPGANTSINTLDNYGGFDSQDLYYNSMTEHDFG